MKINIVNNVDERTNLLFFTDKNAQFKELVPLHSYEIDFIKAEIERNKDLITITRYHYKIFFIIVNQEETEQNYKFADKLRKNGHKILKSLANTADNTLNIINLNVNPKFVINTLEGILLGNYVFDKYISEKKEIYFLENINIVSENLAQQEMDELKYITEGVYITRNLVNEPFATLDTQKFVEEIKNVAKQAEFNCEILDKKKIEALKMGGLLAVNKGSIASPAFAILKWEPENPKNDKPIILVGKGIVYDTGGLSIKPSTSMDTMKSDMAGAATVLGIFYACAKTKIPYNIIGLLPITDNACSNYAITPGDVIQISNGKTVEVMNTDAEGRLILADALVYAKKYNPELVIDMATLTGAAVRTVGQWASIVFSNTDKEVFEKLKNSANSTYERIVELPLWDEYNDALKSHIADLKNIGGIDAGTITSAKFLEHFIEYPWMHLDIAPVAFLENNVDYRGTGATATGLRLLYHFIKNY